MQEVWRILLDDEFVYAWINGIEVECGDGIRQRIYPRIFTYSADYPEKYIYSSDLRCHDRALKPFQQSVDSHNKKQRGLSLRPMSYSQMRVFPAGETQRHAQSNIKGAQR